MIGTIAQPMHGNEVAALDENRRQPACDITQGVRVEVVADFAEYDQIERLRGQLESNIRTLDLDARKIGTAYDRTARRRE